MRTVLAMAMAVSLVAGRLSVASAADEKKSNPQQERMKACNAQAGDKKGDERKAFMPACLKGEAMPMTLQEKMKKCNADASAKSLLTEWGRVTVTWWTHKIRGLHRNDFVMAAKTDALVAESEHVVRGE